MTIESMTAEQIKKAMEIQQSIIETEKAIVNIRNTTTASQADGIELLKLEYRLKRDMMKLGYGN